MSYPTYSARRRSGSGHRLQSSNPLCNAAANDESIKPGPLSGWHAHLVALQRRNCALLVRDTTRDRSVQGTMNQMKQDLEHVLWYDSTNISDLDPYRTGAWLAHRPCGVNKGKSYVWPDKEMLALLDQLSIDARR